MVGNSMTKLIYIEKDCHDHPRAQSICQHFKQAKIISCNHYGEIFNRRAQNFRQQKSNPALILAHKTGQRVLATPESFGIGGAKNFYFSHMLNCIYDCRYCFLQGMYPSAHRVLFINYQDFMDDIDATIEQHAGQHCFFFSGYDGDSVAFEPVSHFIQHFVPFFAKRPQATLELRTKSSNVRALLAHKACHNVVVAFSLLPETIAKHVDYLTPSYQKRLHAMAQVAEAGWPIGLRFDPMILSHDYQQLYPAMVNDIFHHLSPACVHSVSIGPLRFPHRSYQHIRALYPQDRLLAHPMQRREKVMSYPPDVEKKLFDCLLKSLRKYLPKDKIFSCHIF